MSTYQQAISELFDLQRFAIKLGLDNIHSLMEELGNPYLAYPVIHVAGTNGKGSTAFFIAKILESTGLKVGLYTSPHLADFRERIQVNGQQIDETEVFDFWQRIQKLVLHRKATFFDTTTAMALNYFKNQRVDVAIIETGLGGRLDSTNIVSPVLVVITPIHFDHEKQLGNTLREIAIEKAGIIKKNAFIICAEQDPEVLEVIKEKSVHRKAFYYLPDNLHVQMDINTLNGMEFTIKDHFYDQTLKQLQCKQLGDYQINNIALAYFASRIYLDKNNQIFKLDKFKKTLKKNVWPGRVQLMSKNPNIIFDVSHNFIGIKKTLQYLSDLLAPGTLYILIALVQDKDYIAIAETISQYSRDITITEADTHRKLDGKLLTNVLNKAGNRINLIKDLNKAFDFCRKQLSNHDTLLVIGSHYLIGSLMKSKII